MAGAGSSPFCVLILVEPAHAASKIAGFLWLGLGLVYLRRPHARFFGAKNSTMGMDAIGR